MKKMSENKMKRIRTSNFSQQEKTLVINLVAKYKHIIENKRTDAVSNDEKKQTWEKITREFNSLAPANISRTTSMLKRFYDNKKKELRKKVADQKLLLRKTGGGPPLDDNKEPFEDLLISITNDKTVYGLNSNFGGDVESDISSDEQTNNEIILEVESNCDMGSASPKMASTKNIWKTYKPMDLKEPISTPLKSLHTNMNQTQQQQVTEKNNSPDNTPQTEKVLPRSSRRRPTQIVKALTSSELSQKYITLLDSRLDIATSLKKQIEQDIMQSKIKHEKDMALINLQIEVENEKLKKLKRNEFL